MIVNELTTSLPVTTASTLPEPDLERQVAELTSLQQITEAMLSKPLNESLQMIVNETSRLFNMPNVAITVHNDGKWEIVAVSSASDELLNQALQTNDNSIINEVFSTKEFLRSAAAANETSDFSLTTLFPQTQSFIAAPLFADDEVTGVLVAESPYKDMTLASYKNLLCEFARLSSLALKNSRLQNNTLKELADVKHALDSFAIVGITDQRGKITYANDKFCEVSKYSREELLGQDHKILNSGYHSKEFIRNLWTTVARGGIWHNEIKNRAKDGSFFWTDTTIVPLLNEHGKPYQHVVIRNDITEKKKAEEEINEKKEHLQIALESAELGEWSLDLDSSVMKGSEVCKAILGLSQYSEITAEEFMRIIHPEDRKAVGEAFTKALSENKDFHVGYRAVWQDGSIHWIACSARCIYDENGNQVRLVGVIRDYTRRKQAEDELWNKTQQLQLALESGKLGTFQIDLQTGLINASSLLRKLYDFHSDKPVTLEDIYNRTHPEDRNWSHKIRLEAISKGEDYSLEYRIIWDDGSIHWVSTNTHCISDENGKPVRLIGVCRDVTRQKQTENELRRLALVAQKTQNAVLITDVDRHIKWINEGFTRMFGYTLDEIRDLQPSSFLVGPNTDFKVIEELQAAVRNRVEYTCELYNYSKDRYGFWNNVALAPILDEDNLEGNIFILSDLTERKIFEEELAEARDAALESSKLKSQFLANISHEIRTPLNGIIGMTELLLSTELDKEQKDYSEMVCSSADTLLKLINEILDLSKIEAGKFELETIDFDLQEVIEEIFDAFTEKAKRKKIAFASIIDRAVPLRLKGDPYRLKQVLNNLVSNALKFTHEGHVLLKVKAGKSIEGKIELRFAISDTGIGISNEDCAQIFKPFTQADGSMTRKYGGTGLGLSICKQLVELMNGEIGVESNTDVGSTFRFNAFFGNADAAIKIADSNMLADKKALLIESKNHYEYLLKEQLESLGISYGIAENPLECESHLPTSEDDFNYDFIICTSPNPANVLENLSSLKVENQTRPLTVFFYGHATGTKYSALSNVSNNYRTVALPIRQSDFLKTLKGVEETTVKVSNNKNAVPAPLPKSNTKTKVLVVEDTFANQQVAKLMLSRLGCDVDISDNGSAALDAIENNNYDLVFMDCQMPVMDGYDATRELRHKEKTSQKHSIVVAMTAHALPVDKEKCLAAGMDDYLSKPVKQKDLIAILEKWCNNESEKEQNMIQLTSNTASPFALELFERLDDLSLFLEATDLSDIIDQFTADAPVLLKELTDAIAVKDSQQAKKSAHSLKGSLANIGSARLAECCADIEEQAKNNSLRDVGESYSQLKEHWGEIIEVLSTYKDKLSG